MIAVVDYHKGNLKSVERGLIAAGGNALITDDPAVIARADAIVLPGVGAFADAAATMQQLGQTDIIRQRVQEGVPFLGICLGQHLMFEEGEEGEIITGEDEEPQRPRGLGILPGVVGKLPKQDAQGKSYKIPHVGWNSIYFARADATGELLDAAASCGIQSCHAARDSSTEVHFASTSLPVLNATETLADLTNDAINSVSTSDDVLSEADDLTNDAVSSSSTSDDVLSEAAGFTNNGSRLFEGIAQGEYFYFTHSYAVPDGPFAIAYTTHSITFPCAVQYGDVAFGVQFHPEKSSDAGAKLLRNFINITKEA